MSLLLLEALNRRSHKGRMFKLSSYVGTTTDKRFLSLDIFLSFLPFVVMSQFSRYVYVYLFIYLFCFVEWISLFLSFVRVDFVVESWLVAGQKTR